jgi:hypothetical protein
VHHLFFLPSSSPLAALSAVYAAHKFFLSGGYKVLSARRPFKV